MTKRRWLLLALTLTVFALLAAHALAEADAPARARPDDQLARVQAGEHDLELRVVNPEYDLMARTFLVLGFASRAASGQEPAQPLLEAIDTLIARTLDEERAHGDAHFLLPYVHAKPFVAAYGRSLFVDGELALMLAARQVVEHDPRYDADLAARVARIVAALEAGPLLSAESYPDECWTFCNTIALAALRFYDARYGTDHGALMRRWVALARAKLIDAETGLLVSSYRYDGTHLDGPEGSTLWVATHNLRFIDEAFAREQYALAKRHLAVEQLGLGWSREWPEGRDEPEDVDSGPVVPGLGASAGASGLAFIGAGAFDDGAYERALFRSLALAEQHLPDGSELQLLQDSQLARAIVAYGRDQRALANRIPPLLPLTP